MLQMLSPFYSTTTPRFQKKKRQAFGVRSNHTKKNNKRTHIQSCIVGPPHLPNPTRAFSPCLHVIGGLHLRETRRCNKCSNHKAGDAWHLAPGWFGLLGDKLYRAFFSDHLYSWYGLAKKLTFFLQTPSKNEQNKTKKTKKHAKNSEVMRSLELFFFSVLSPERKGTQPPAGGILLGRGSPGAQLGIRG